MGSYLKKPRSSVWVLGSETHLTGELAIFMKDLCQYLNQLNDIFIAVLFSFEKRLTNSETPADIARRVFSQFDPEGNNFISSDLLGALLERLDLVSDNE